MPDSMKGSQEPTEEQIRACAQRIYETEGRPEGKAMEHWLKAESQCRAELKAQAGSAQKKTSTKSAPAESAGERSTNKSRANAPWQTQNTPRPTMQHN